jgi:histidinol phosphatase-like PHP family hydrolase
MKTYFLLLGSVLLILASSCNSPEKKSSAEEILIQRIDSLNKQGFEITDYHAHLKGGLTIEQLLVHSAKTGISYGVAVNGGLGFPVQNDSALSNYFRQMKNQPVYHGLQGEGREWVRLFSADSVALFDYVFTDAMTFTDAQGRRNRLWIKDETFVSDPQIFMEYLVSQIETIFSNEKVNIYVNPTFLPDTLKSQYNELWTTERINRVITVLKKNNIALEINSRLMIPSSTVIKMAKEAGIKFTMGTNNTNSDLGYLEYGLKMITECGLKPEDFWKCKKKS